MPIINGFSKSPNLNPRDRYIYRCCPRDHHGKHFIDYDRTNPPSWIDFGPIGLDDKRKLGC